MSHYRQPSFSRQTPATQSALKTLECQRVGTPGLGSRLSTYWPTKWCNKWWCNQHTSADQTPITCVPVAWAGLKPKGRVWRAGAPALSNRTGLARAAKPKHCSDAGTGDLGVLTTHERSPWFALGDSGSTRPGWMPPQVQASMWVLLWLKVI